MAEVKDRLSAEMSVLVHFILLLLQEVYLDEHIIWKLSPGETPGDRKYDDIGL